MTLLRQMSLACVRGKWKERTKKARSGHTPSFWYRIPICQSLFRLTNDVEVAARGVSYPSPGPRPPRSNLWCFLERGSALCSSFKQPHFSGLVLSASHCSCSCSFFLLSRDQEVFSISTKIGKLAFRYSVDKSLYFAWYVWFTWANISKIYWLLKVFLSIKNICHHQHEFLMVFQKPLKIRCISCCNYSP